MNFWERYGECLGNNGNRGSDRGGNRSGANGYTGNNNGYTANSNRGGYSEQDVRRKFEQYNGKDENELMSELASTVARMKSEGTFDAAAIENMYNTASPFLSDMQ